MTDETTPQKVARIINDLLPELLRLAGPIDESAKAFWTEWYTRKFTAAIDERGAVHDAAAKAMLMQRINVLAANARGRAHSGRITAEHAEGASRETDCRRPADGPFEPFDVWCY